jgi:hypothetical protein
MVHSQAPNQPSATAIIINSGFQPISINYFATPPTGSSILADLSINNSHEGKNVRTA